jgi:hypothetical protein
VPKPHGLTGWIDEDRDRLRLEPLPVWIDWFEYRVHLVSINPLRHILDTQITADPDSSALLIAGVSLCSTIEATGKFITGVEDAAGRTIGNGMRFERFVTDYMSKELGARHIGKRSYSTIIWKDFRNGLAHGFAVCGGGFNGNRGNPYFGLDASGNLTVNPAELFDDFVQGFKRYVADLRAGDPKVVMFEKMFQHVFIDGK